MPAQVLEIDYSDQFDFELIGLASSQRDHRVAWAVNRVLGWSLVRTDDLQITGRTGSSKHTRFIHRLPEDHAQYTLIANRGDGGWLLPEWSRFDYLIKIEEEHTLRDGGWSRGLRESRYLDAALDLPLDKLKSIHHLIIT